ncbi:MAG: glutamate synthase subunit beta [Clostridia bacterium]|nr:glutamate synthase subunit beta [Clostridia bacterium]
MGKPTGFMEFSRELNQAVSPLDRIKNFSEFHAPLNNEQRKTQAARCMNCGVPFCQSGVAFSGGAVSGCPLHNLIPEWNDEIYNGNDREALSRLLKTNNFPEFTGRVCPALCEAACTCGLNDDPVTVKENELYTIETGFANGWMEPKIPKVRTDKKVAVIGSGPSGLAAADRLNQRGHNVTVFERDSRPGGLLMYGIPNMKLEKSVIERRVKLMKKEGVVFRCGTDIGKDIDAQTIVDSFDAVIICCGAKQPRSLKNADDSVNGIMYAVDYLSDATREVIGEKENSVSAKDKNVIIVGGGDTGNDCVGTSIRQGCKSVIQLEMMPKLPDSRAENNPWPQWPRVCKTDYGQEEAIAVFGSDPRIYQTTVNGIVTNEKGELTAVKTVKLEPKTVDGRMVMHEIENSEEELPCELMLIAAGFTGCQSYVPEAFGVTLTPRGTVETDANRYATSTDKIFAAGDARRGQSLVVWAIAEGRACAKEVDEYLMQYTDMI